MTTQTTLDIAQVPHLYRPSIGGIENYVYRLNRSAEAAGHDVTTYTTDRSLQDASSQSTVDGRVHYCDTDLSLLRNPVSRELYRRLDASDHDVYHLHSPWFLSTLEAAHAIPDDATTVMTVHSAEITSTSSFVRALNTVYRPFAQYVFDRVDHSFVQGATERRRLLDRFDVDPASVSVVPNAIHPAEYDVPDADVRAFQEEYGLDPDVPTVLFVSRLVPAKHPDVFVDAVTDHLPDTDLQALVVGSGDDAYVDDLRGRADDRIQFYGTLPFEDLKASYHASDLFVFLGTWEGLPTVILEAMNARLPVVSTAAGAIPDAVTDGENGTIVSSPPDARAVATAIRYYLDLPSKRVAVGDRNRATVRETYRWETVAGTILSKYNTLVGRAGTE
ncbi:glycosyltransferase [Halapricum sp. CBA1109]|uniref:glycosyltransferase family 4 protein n=1 Tax=Halapricum sp. CBA1109 TaxID=2668068 RepID=UPI0012FB502E|nr:glycosyltransferase family 4 protein [Halapricum sp. CBA1109]MUV88838.1 glycosyltransferase [Halapricum sp. CBA1109]